MTVFTNTFTTDHSIDRWTTEVDGVRYEIAYTQDTDAESPFDWGWDGIYILSHDYRLMHGGDESIQNRLDEWLSEKDLLEDMLENPHNYADADLEGIDAGTLEDHDEARPRISVFDFWDFTVFVDLDVFEGSEDTARDLAYTYRTWCNGDVYLAGITRPDGGTDYLGGIYLDEAEPPREQMEDIMRDML